MTEEISIQEISNTFRAGAKQYRMFEKGVEIADRIMGLEQHANDLDKTVAEKREALTEAQDNIALAEKTAQTLIDKGQEQADKIIQDAITQVEKDRAKATEDFEMIDAEITLAREKLNDLKTSNQMLETGIAEKTAQLKAANKELEDIRARLKAI